MKRVLSVFGVCLIIAFVAVSTSYGMGKAKDAKCTKCPTEKCMCGAEGKACAKCPEGKCVCGIKPPKKCCGDDPSKCCAKDAAKKACCGTCGAKDAEKKMHEHAKEMEGHAKELAQ